MYDIHNNLTPDNIKNMFTKLTTVHSYRTTSVTNENYYVDQIRTENMKRVFSISSTLFWNSIPLSIKALKTKINLKAHLRENSLKFWKKRTIILEFLILECNSQNHSIAYFWY